MDFSRSTGDLPEGLPRRMVSVVPTLPGSFSRRFNVSARVARKGNGKNLATRLRSSFGSPPPFAVCRPTAVLLRPAMRDGKLPPSLRHTDYRAVWFRRACGRTRNSSIHMTLGRRTVLLDPDERGAGLSRPSGASQWTFPANRSTHPNGGGGCAAGGIHNDHQNQPRTPNDWSGPQSDAGASPSVVEVGDFCGRPRSQGRGFGWNTW